ncbi:proteasome accessory factor PafA2 [Parenemella sanctibonifatiensis]|uniref:Proteasome accessory factor PafA2 n=2 Tax=Parenemella sanctibonifatiensis TaxID=2016505 RepID=A0A255EIK1_9ACTN|nr:proteasome accessory factor PafA2 [Parenemella sanctibonifatiensis]
MVRGCQTGTMTAGSPVFGIENEYGISATVDGRQLSAPALSDLIVRSHPIRAAAGWDFAAESPLRDARGFSLARDEAIADLQTDLIGVGANRTLRNGARWYVDHAHPEYSGPEVTDPADAVRWDEAGDRIALAAAQTAGERLGVPVRIYKNNTDSKGASYGTHENYLLPRAVEFEQVVAEFTGFLVSRSVLAGAGRVGIGVRGERPGFQLTQRADFFERVVGLETTTRRPLVNTRDEPHADFRQWRRLHVITGDGNRTQYATWLKLGSAALVLQALGQGRLHQLPQLGDPVRDHLAVSHDLDLSHRIQLDGSSATAIELQRRYLDLASGIADPPAWADDILTSWEQLLSELVTDPASASDRVDWIAKHQLLDGYRRRHQLGWDAPQLAALDIQWADLDPAKSPFSAWQRRGSARTIVTDEEVAQAVEQPPADTRALLRGALVRAYEERLAAVTWDGVSLDTGERILRLGMSDPTPGWTPVEIAEAVTGDILADVPRLERLTRIDRDD